MRTEKVKREKKKLFKGHTTVSEGIFKEFD